MTRRGDPSPSVSMEMMDFIVAGVLISGAVVLFWAIVTGRMPEHGGSLATLTCFHDWQPKDKQEAVQEIIERNAGKQTPVTTSSTDDGKGKTNEPQ